MDRRQRKQAQFSLVYVLVAILAVWLFQELVFRPLLTLQQQVPYSQFREDLAAGRITEVMLGEELIVYARQAAPAQAGETPRPPGAPGGSPPGAPPVGPATPAREGEAVSIHNVVRVDDPELVEDLRAAGVTFRGQPPASGLLTTLLGWLLPLVPLLLLWYLVFRQLGRSGPNILTLGKSRAKEVSGELTGITFADVGGVDEVEAELSEIIAFLREPARFARMGAKLPKGVLLVGPPGTGKTLLAKATAGEARVPFFSISGSDFVEMFVGVGAARVRDLFEQAKAKAPCIVFIDEIDAIGQARSAAGAVHANDEREHTLNQLLSEMDGFEPNQGVIIMAATNRPEVLDRALLRPGRFDRQLEVPLPGERGRRQILAIHTRGMPLAPDVSLDRLARITAGFSGAELANIVNEAALMAVRKGREQVAAADFDLGIERVVAGLQRKEPLDEETKRRVAYHEGGHALVAQLLPHAEPVHKVSIVPTAKGALGYTLQMPDEDRYLVGEQELKERLAVLLGGRAAELLHFGEASTGASNDLQRATDLARRMVAEFGMTEALGPVRYAASAGAGYLGAESGLRPDLSPETAALADREVRRLVEEAQAQALRLLSEHRAALDAMATALLEREAISGEEVAGFAASRAPVA